MTMDVNSSGVLPSLIDRVMQQRYGNVIREIEGHLREDPLPLQRHLQVRKVK